MNSGEIEGFAILGENDLSGLEEQKGIVNEAFHKSFVDASQGKQPSLLREMNPYNALKEWAQSKQPPKFLFRLSDQKRDGNILYRRGDYTKDKEAIMIPRPLKRGSSLLTLFGCIHRGQVEGFIYISPKIKILQTFFPLFGRLA